MDEQSGEVGAGRCKRREGSKKEEEARKAKKTTGLKEGEDGSADSTDWD